jgi:hypothetical protein
MEKLTQKKYSNEGKNTKQNISLNILAKVVAEFVVVASS